MGLTRAVGVAAVFGWLVLGAAGARAQRVDLSGLARVTDAASADATLPTRIGRVLDMWASKPASPFPTSRDNYSRFTVPALAKLERGVEVAHINRQILAPGSKPFGVYGTRARVLGRWCQRDGDYDFMAQDLVRLAYRNLERPDALWPESLRKIAFDLLPVAGSRHHWRFRLGLCGTHRETENHVLMTETARYLTNQLRRRLGETDERYDNRRNGFDEWMLRHLARFLRRHFEEYNSRPYQGYTVKALNNLHSYAESPRVKRAAGMVLDYLSAVFAVQSNGLRRFPPFRRQPRYSESSRLWERDSEMARFVLLLGSQRFTERFDGQVPYGEHVMLDAALSEYRVEPMLANLVLSPREHFQRLHHDGVEIYAGSKSFLISGGGRFRRHFKAGSQEQHGWARPTVVIPTRDTHVDARYWLRVEGADDARRRNNTCVLPGFACGVNVRIPDALPAGCHEAHGRFRLLNLSAPACSVDLGIYAAVWRSPCDGRSCRKLGSNYGFFEVVEASGTSFEAFRRHVVEHNTARRYRSDQRNTYIMADGREVVFEPIEGDRWPIVSVDGERRVRKFRRWPRARGHILNADGEGLVTVDNTTLGERLVLDMREPLNPQRRLEPLGPTLRAKVR